MLGRPFDVPGRLLLNGIGELLVNTGRSALVLFMLDGEVGSEEEDGRESVLGRLAEDGWAWCGCTDSEAGFAGTAKTSGDTILSCVAGALTFGGSYAAEGSGCAVAEAGTELIWGGTEDCSDV